MAAPTIAAGAHTAAYAYGYWPAAGLDGYHWHYGDGLSAGAIPTNDGLACVFVGGPPAVVARRRAIAGRSLCSGNCWPGWTEVSPTSPRRRRPARFGSSAECRRRLRRPYGPGWALVGDSGWWKDPLSTHGITAALHDAELLTAAVVAGAASQPAAELALAGYQERRDRSRCRCTPSSIGSRPTSGTTPRPAGCCAGCPSVMAAEVEAILGFDPAPARTG